LKEIWSSVLFSLCDEVARNLEAVVFEAKSKKRMIEVVDFSFEKVA